MNYLRFERDLKTKNPNSIELGFSMNKPLVN